MPESEALAQSDISIDEKIKQAQLQKLEAEAESIKIAIRRERWIVVKILISAFIAASAMYFFLKPALEQRSELAHIKAERALAQAELQDTKNQQNRNELENQRNILSRQIQVLNLEINEQKINFRQREHDLVKQIEASSAKLTALESSSTISESDQAIISDLRLQNTNMELLLAAERQRAEDYETRMSLARQMLQSWMNALDSSGSEISTILNILFIQIQISVNPFDQDPQFLEALLDRRSDIVIPYVESLDPAKTSPITRALWYEIIASWLDTDQPDRAAIYRNKAAELVTKYAPKDTLWLSRISDGT